MSMTFRVIRHDNTNTLAISNGVDGWIRLASSNTNGNYIFSDDRLTPLMIYCFSYPLHVFIFCSKV